MHRKVYEDQRELSVHQIHIEFQRSLTILLYHLAIFPQDLIQRHFLPKKSEIIKYKKKKRTEVIIDYMNLIETTLN